MTGDAPVRVVCFDLGGVVVRICRDWDEACRRARVDVREPDRFHEPALKAARRELVGAYQIGRVACDAFFAGVADRTGGLYTQREVRAVHDAWLVETYPGAAELVARLNAAPALATACLSNTNAAHWDSMTRGPFSCPALGAIERPMASHLLGLAKPDDAIYARAETELNASGPEIAFFDDTAENIDAARARGWCAELIDPDADPPAQVGRALETWGVRF